MVEGSPFQPPPSNDMATKGTAASCVYSWGEGAGMVWLSVGKPAAHRLFGARELDLISDYGHSILKIREKMPPS